MATHSSVLAWRIPMDRGVWVGYSPWGHKESDTTEQLTMHRGRVGGRVSTRRENGAFKAEIVAL